jgi:hypothetical protein
MPSSSSPPEDGSSQPTPSMLSRANLSEYKRFAELAGELKGSLSGYVFSRLEGDERQPSASPPLLEESEESKAVERESSPSEFAESTRLFNAAATLSAWLVVRPVNAQDVVK